MLFNKKEDKEDKEKKLGFKMSDADAVSLLKSWGNELEVDTDSKDFEDVIKQLKIPVRKENLTYDPNIRGFKYYLFQPIEKRDSSEPIKLIEIKPVKMNDKKGIQNFKDSQKIDQSLVMIAESCGLELGFAGRLEEKDIGRINAVVIGFFV